MRGDDQRLRLGSRTRSSAQALGVWATRTRPPRTRSFTPAVPGVRAHLGVEPAQAELAAAPPRPASARARLRALLPRHRARLAGTRYL